jgi:hypothetical protein
MKRGVLLLAILMLASALCVGAGRFKLSNARIIEIMGGECQQETLWLSGELGDRIHTILGSRYSTVRLHYWMRAEKVFWQLDVMGKVEPITFGIVTHRGKILELSVLKYRESHGMEIRRSTFLDQFKEATLDPSGNLSIRIDGIAGASISVNATVKAAKMALVLDQYIPFEARSKE